MNTTPTEPPGPQVSVFLAVAGTNWDPIECARALGLEASEIWFEPEFLVRDGRRKASWSYGFKRRNFDNIDEAVNTVLNDIWPRREELRKFVESTGYSLCLACNVTIWSDRPLYELLPETMSRLAWLGCPFLLDIFDYSEKGESSGTQALPGPQS